MGTTVALTGATGFLGRHLAAAARDAGLRVIAVVRDPDRARAALLDTGLAEEVRRADLGEPDALAAAFAGVDVVLANAALGSWSGDADLYLRTNLDGTRNTIHAAARADVPRVVQVSTVAVYRPRLRHMLDEGAPRRDKDPPIFDPTRLTTDIRYSRTKTLAEDAARAAAQEHSLDLRIVRPGPIYGSHDTRFTARLVGSLRRPVVIQPTVGVPLVHARDVADATVEAARRTLPSGAAWNLAGPPVPLAEVHRTLRRLASRDGLVISLPVPLWAGFDCSAAERDLAFRNRPLEEGLAEVLAHHPDAPPAR